MKVLDTTFIVDLLRNKEGVDKVLKQEDILVTTQINMFEIVRGLLRKIIKEIEISREEFIKQI